MGKAVMNLSIEEKIISSLFLCSDNPNEILEALKPELNKRCKLALDEKLLIINSSFSIQNVFPWKEELSEGIEHENFCRSFFVQPDLFLRLRPGNEKEVKHKLSQSGIDFKVITDTCLALPNASKIDTIIELDKEAVIQDFNSQNTGESIKSRIQNRKSKISVWDCCAASGGKSLMTYDLNPNIDLIVSDVRESILANLKRRFTIAGIKNYKSFVADLTSGSQIPNLKPQIIIADVPCSGSGTWSRTPEQLYFFQERKIEEYANLQKKIVANAIPQLQNGGSFIYITCSVFKKENEEAVEFIKEKFPLELKHMGLLKGYDKKADSMFAAVFENPL